MLGGLYMDFGTRTEGLMHFWGIPIDFFQEETFFYFFLWE